MEEEILISPKLLDAINNDNKRKFYSALQEWFYIADNNPINIPFFLNTEAFVSDLILYTIKEKYETFFPGIKLKLAHRINKSVLIRIYEYLAYGIIDYLKDEIRIDLSEDFKKKYFDLSKTIGSSKINEILYLAEIEKFDKVLPWNCIEEFENYFATDFLKIFHLFNSIKKRKGQPSKYTDDDFAELNKVISEGVKQKIAAKKVLSKRGYLHSSPASFLKLNRERLPEGTLIKIRRNKSGN